MKASHSPNRAIQIEYGSPKYPLRLNDLYDPPKTLYIFGDVRLLDMPMIAIVGSRAASPDGIKNACLFARALSKEGLLVLSGLAKGVDSAAHQATLETKAGRTAAVLGTGIDIVYPRQNIGLSQAISQQGLLISELPLGVGPKAFHFPRRNRIIAALALGVVVVEAAEKSGSLITARLAAELGREVFALPGSIHSANSAGCHLLIQQGAKLAYKPRDILEELHF
jgi:DNA processing protein